MPPSNHISSTPTTTHRSSTHPSQEDFSNPDRRKYRSSTSKPLPLMYIKKDQRNYVQIANILTYPHLDVDLARRRIEDMVEMGATHVEFLGRSEIAGFRVLGKGTTSIVLKLWMGCEPVAVKILRTDANRESVLPEVERLKIANRVRVGPKLISHRDDMIMMEYIEGVGIIDALSQALTEHQSLKGRRLTSILRRILHQCFLLDRVGLDHGQLTRPDDHIYILPRGRVKILDFETASTERRTSNITAFTQFLLYRPPISEGVRETLGLESLQEVLKSLKEYKVNPRVETYRRVLRSLKLI
jgi:putative serine/threonine protein kinase